MGRCHSTLDNRPHVHTVVVLPDTPVVNVGGCRQQPESSVFADNCLPRASAASESTTATDLSPCRGSHDDLLYVLFDTTFSGRAGAARGVNLGDEQVRHAVELCARYRRTIIPSHRYFSPLLSTSRAYPKCPVCLRVRALLPSPGSGDSPRGVTYRRQAVGPCSSIAQSPGGGHLRVGRG
jgi:hypothetical protein